MLDLADISPTELEAVLTADPELAAWHDVFEDASYLNFRPREDKPELYDEQESFCHDRVPVAFLVGGNAAGTTEAAAYKTALFLLRQQPPPRKDTPFWVISNTYDQCCGVCWGEKLNGHQHIPDCEVDWERVTWMKRSAGWPFRVPLKPWPKEHGGHPDRNWCLEFKSFEQGRKALQARSIGGFWFSEQFPLELLIETYRGCREYHFPGSCFAEFTPIDPTLSMWVERVMEHPPKGWKFYRANTECNRENLAEDWYEEFFELVPEEMQRTRKIGELAGFEGVIYQTFNPKVHVVGDDEMTHPNGVDYYRSFDWGFSREHPWVTLWAYRDQTGRWFIFDEYVNGRSGLTADDHAEKTLEVSELWGWPKPGVKHPHYHESYGDPSRPDLITTLNRYGINVGAALNDVAEGIECVQGKMKVTADGPGLYVHERCVKTIEQIRKYRWLRGRRPEDNPGLLNPAVARPEPLKRDDDTCDALRYLVFTVEKTHGRVITSMPYAEWRRKSIPLAKGGGNGHNWQRDGNGNGNGNGWRRGIQLAR